DYLRTFPTSAAPKTALSVPVRAVRNKAPADLFQIAGQSARRRTKARTNARTKTPGELTSLDAESGDHRVQPCRQPCRSFPARAAAIVALSASRKAPELTRTVRPVGGRRTRSRRGGTR